LERCGNTSRGPGAVRQYGIHPPTSNLGAIETTGFGGIFLAIIGFFIGVLTVVFIGVLTIFFTGVVDANTKRLGTETEAVIIRDRIRDRFIVGI
jgi:hypothetical protein